jgi:hypothetical protein
LFAATTTGKLAARRIWAISWSSRAHARTRVDHQQRDLRVGDRLARLVLDRDGERVLVLEVDAAGVDQGQPPPFHSVLSSLRSRVTPGRSWTDRLARLREPVDRATTCRRWGSRRPATFIASSRASNASVIDLGDTRVQGQPVVSTARRRAALVDGAGARASRRSRSSCWRDLRGPPPPARAHGRARSLGSA